MAYQIKSIRYQNNPRKILLQNINGPCPLLAAANALLLRGVIALSSECIRNGVASTDDVVSMLANRALMRSTEKSSHHHHEEYHLNEVLSILPTLQHGMDVNPQFTSPQSVEYTHNLAAFDMLGVELVHGWVVDPQDTETCAVVERKSYNELIELVICGGDDEMKKEVGRLEELKVEKERQLMMVLDSCKGNNKQIQTTEEGGVEVVTNDVPDHNTESSTSTLHGHSNEPLSIQQQQQQQQQQADIEQEIADIGLKLEEASLQISRAEVAHAFLTSTSHQLTYHGLEQLHNYIGNDTLHVFFRNNHFGTITKHNDMLYLLVTDLGYANTPEIIWEKLDSIDGNTEYVNEYFEKPIPRTELAAAAGPTIDPALLLAQRSQSENDYKLAMAISKGEVNVSTSTTSFYSEEEDEGKLIEAAKELSLRTYHGETNATLAVLGNSTHPSSTNHSQLDSDHQMALAFQREEEQLIHESEQLARQLQALDQQEDELWRRQQRNNTNRRRHPPATSSRPEETKSGCIIS
ncbi:hypothetical protein ACHAXM_008674 [Skeletonema potamos]